MRTSLSQVRYHVTAAPVARQSGPRTRKAKKGQGDSYLRGLRTQAANGTSRTDTFLGERLRRLAKRRGGARARVAVARFILIIIWHLLADPEARFPDLGPDWHARKTDKDKKTRSHLRQIRALGWDVALTPEPPDRHPALTRPGTKPPRALKPCRRMLTEAPGQL